MLDLLVLDNLGGFIVGILTGSLWTVLVSRYFYKLGSETVYKISNNLSLIENDINTHQDRTE